MILDRFELLNDPCGTIVNLPDETLFGGRTMGTTYQIRMRPAPRNPADLLRRIEDELDRIVQLMSHFENESELSRFNRAPSGADFELSPDHARVLKEALRVWQRTDGAFDPALGRLIEVLGFGKTVIDEMPKQSLIDEARSLGGARHLHLDGQCLRSERHVWLNLSGIAKGFAVDRICEMIQSRCDSFLVEIGGEVSGKHKDGFWRVLVENPLVPELPLVISLRSGSIATSGTYLNQAELQGSQISHILDPIRDGCADSTIQVCVTGPSCMTADALATAFLILGKRSREFIPSFPGYDYAMLGDGRRIYSSGFDKALDADSQSPRNSTIPSRIP